MHNTKQVTKQNGRVLNSGSEKRREKKSGGKFGASTGSQVYAGKTFLTNLLADRIESVPHVKGIGKYNSKNKPDTANSNRVFQRKITTNSGLGQV